VTAARPFSSGVANAICHILSCSGFVDNAKSARDVESRRRADERTQSDCKRIRHCGVSSNRLTRGARIGGGVCCVRGVRCWLCCRYNVTAADFALITRNVLQSAPHKAGIQWKFAGSVYFSTTVITTIGRPFVVVAAVSGCSHIILAASRRVLRQRLRLWRSLLAPSALSLCATLRRCRRRSSGNSEVTALFYDVIVAMTALVTD